MMIADKTLAPIHPNSGIQAAYRRRLNRLIDDMHKSIRYWLLASYKANMAQDEAPTLRIRTSIRKLSRQWQRNFDKGADELAVWFAQKTKDYSDPVLKRILKDAGFSVEFKMSEGMRDAYQAVIGEQVGLIKSIASHHLTQVETIVMQGVQNGRDAGFISNALAQQYGVTKRRAALIARDQTSKATATLNRVRRLELGITEAEWVHSGGGKTPRPSHVRAGRERLRFDVAKGALIDGEYIQPGELINCFAGDVSVLVPKDGLIRLWRSPFNGPMIYIDVGSDLLKGTPNHPILTSRGWIALGLLEDGDQVVCMTHECGNVIDHDKDERVTTFAELFESRSASHIHRRRFGTCFNFYGDTPNGDVDEIIIEDRHLSSDGQVISIGDVSDFGLSESYGVILGAGNGGMLNVPHSDGASSSDEALTLISGLSGSAHQAGVSAGAHDVMTHKDGSNIRRAMARESKLGSNCGGPKSALVHGNDDVGETFPVPAAVRLDSDGAELFAEFVRVAANNDRRVFEFGAATHEFRSVRNKRVWDFSGHVYTMQVDSGHYSISGAFVQAKNCKCVSRPVIKGLNA